MNESDAKGAAASDQSQWKNESLLESLYKAARKNNLSLALQCINGGVPLNHLYTQNEHTALHECAWKGHLQITELLCRAGANPNIQDSRRFLPLHYACQMGHTDIVKTLLSYGSSVLLHNEYGDAPLHTTARYNKIALVPLLIAHPNHHMWVEKRNKKTIYVLDSTDSRMPYYERHTLSGLDSNHRAVKQITDGEKEFVEHVNLQNSNGDTAMHIAVALARKRMVRRLLSLGASAFIRNHQSRTPYDIAQERRDASIARIIRKNAGLPYPKYWLAAPPDPPENPMIYLPTELEDRAEQQDGDDTASQESGDLPIKHQLHQRSYLEPITLKETISREPSEKPLTSQKATLTDRSFDSSAEQPDRSEESRAPSPCCSPGGLHLAKTSLERKKNLTFKLDEPGHKSQGKCYHHLTKDPTKTIELEPQPNNRNNMDWRYQHLLSTWDLEKKSEKEEQPLPISTEVKSTEATGGNCSHVCRNCVPHYGLSSFNPADDVTQRYKRIEDLSRSVEKQIQDINDHFPDLGHIKETTVSATQKKRIFGGSVTGRKLKKSRVTSSRKGDTKLLLIKCSRINPCGRSQPKQDKSTSTSLRPDEGSKQRGTDKVLFQRQKWLWGSAKKKPSVDSTHGLDDLMTKSLDETWVTGEKILVEIHPEENGEPKNEDELSSSSSSSWTSDDSSGAEKIREVAGDSCCSTSDVSELVQMKRTATMHHPPVKSKGKGKPQSPSAPLQHQTDKATITYRPEYDYRLVDQEARRDNFVFNTSWSNYNRSLSVSRIGTVSPKIREIQDQLRRAQNKSPIY